MFENKWSSNLHCLPFPSHYFEFEIPSIFFFTFENPSISFPLFYLHILQLLRLATVRISFVPFVPPYLCPITSSFPPFLIFSFAIPHLALLLKARIFNLKVYPNLRVRQLLYCFESSNLHLNLQSSGFTYFSFLSHFPYLRLLQTFSSIHFQISKFFKFFHLFSSLDLSLVLTFSSLDLFSAL